MDYKKLDEKEYTLNDLIVGDVILTDLIGEYTYNADIYLDNQICTLVKKKKYLFGLAEKMWFTNEVGESVQMHPHMKLTRISNGVYKIKRNI